MKVHTALPQGTSRARSIRTSQDRSDIAAAASGVTRLPGRLLQSVLALSLCGLATSVAAQGLVSPCTGISLPRSSVFNYLDPVLSPLVTTVSLLDPLGTLGLAGIYSGLSSGQPLAFNVFDTNGNLLSASDGCRVTTDGYSLNTSGGISIGGNRITGLGDGAPSSAAEKSAIAIGDGASTGTGAMQALALGSGATVNNGVSGGVALGAGSVASGVLAPAYVPVGSSYAVAGQGPGATRELSIGTVDNERRITNVAAGGADTDAVNVSQLRAVASLSDGVVRYDDPSATKVTLGGPVSGDGGVTGGTRLTNVAQGAVSAGSTDAVNGTQLFQTREDLNTSITTTNSNLATTTNNLATLNTQISSGSIGLVQQVGGAPGNGIITVGAGTGGTVINVAGTDGPRVLTGVAAGVGPTDAVNMSQLQSVGQQAANSVQYDSAGRTQVTLGGPASSDGGVTGGTRVTNVAQGDLSATSTDAVNGSQLARTNSNVGTLVTALGGNATVNADGSVSGPTYTLTSILAGGQVTLGSYTTVGDALGALGTSVVNLNQSIGAPGGVLATSRYLQVNSTLPGASAAGADSMALGPQAVAGGTAAVAAGLGAQATGTQALALGAGAVASSNGGVALGAGANAERAGMAGQAERFSGVSVASTQGAVAVGAAGAERQITHVAGGTEATDAVNVRQLQAVQAGAVSYAAAPNGSPDYGRVVLGNGQAPNGTVLSNVAPGVAPTDAVNVQQLQAGMGQAALYTDVRMHQMQQGLEKVAQKAYAGVAAAMALEGAPYVPGKLSYAAGMGHYEGQSAVGVALRHTAASGRWSVTGGVSASANGGVAVRMAVAGVFE